MEGNAVKLYKTVMDQEGERLELEYHLLEEEIALNGAEVNTYGIEISDHRSECRAVRDISPDRAAVMELLELFWRMDVTPITLEDIVQDCIEN